MSDEWENVVNELRLLCAVCRGVMVPVTVYQKPVRVPSGRLGLIYGHEECIMGDYQPLQPQGFVTDLAEAATEHEVHKQPDHATTK